MTISRVVEQGNNKMEKILLARSELNMNGTAQNFSYS
jgi:hypothetical protein